MHGQGDSSGDVDVAVVGGGPGGLATAAAFKAALDNSVCVKVSDRSASVVINLLSEA